MKTMDFTTPNRFGRLLVDLCMSNELCILNGRCKGDENGSFTSFNYKGSSVIDYGIVSKTLFQNVAYFKAHDLAFFSSHCLLLYVLSSLKVMMIILKGF